MDNKILKQVKYILDTYNNKVKSDKHLILLHWQLFDGVDMNKQIISTPDFLSKATDPELIISAKHMLEAIRCSE
ncbi:hypothetical protein [Lederbergia lenta]|uniref:hypothetical protein n=1 Tax=Lederbergia lenta TaxID=1467 RepID=UPI00203C22B6|nr:hypothetical protein [Lederbergia lenta]MCM3109881.1 hypothetical protein [Lederbergia lenta]